MAVKKRDIEVTIQSLSLERAGSIKVPSESRHAVTVDLIWPRTTVSVKRFTRVVTLKKNVCQFEGLQDWADSILFKGTVEGRFAIRVMVSRPLIDSIAEKLLRGIMKAAAGEVADRVEGFVPKDLDKIFSSPIDAVGTLIAGEEQVPLAEATRVMDAGEIPAMGQVVEFPLVSSCNLTESRTRPNGKGDRNVTLLKKGAPNGILRLAFEVQ